MKSSIFMSFLAASLIVLATGCGKSKGGGGNTNTYSGMNPIINQGISASGQAALNNLKTWYATAEVPTLGYRGTYVKKTEQLSSFTFQGSLCFFGKGINCSAPTPTNCYKLNAGTNSYDMGTATGTDLNQCTITQQNVTKANNQELAAAVNGSGYQLIDVQQQGNVFYLVYGYSMYNPQVVYTIDTNYHSILNPVQTQNISGSTVSRTSISYLQTFGF